MNCRHCTNPLSHVFLDIGFAPPSNAYLTKQQLKEPEVYYPLKVFVCDSCWLVQTEDYACADVLFDKDYAYFSSTSSSWLEHARCYVEDIVPKLQLDENSFVIEIASNDGYLLKNFISNGIPCLGIEPTQSTAAAAEALGIPVVREFFGADLAKTLSKSGRKADLIIGNNVFAHVPDINDFTAGLKCVLNLEGSITLEFPHLLNLISENQFDTVYHEHFSYLSLNSVSTILKKQDLRVWDVERLSTHGGSLRVFICHIESSKASSTVVSEILQQEKAYGLLSLKPYELFQVNANKVKNDLVQFLISEHSKGKRIAAYGAAAKGNTLLNYGGVKPDLIEFVCDAAESKQNKFLPGSHIPILMPSALREKKPDWVIIFPWNLVDEIKNAHSYIGEWGGKFVTAVPKLNIH
ncbi:MAG: class I SAM-dependent methyltransferase [Gammaproteobacteria bacterium]|nr:class I SAM-dependent methyltransferase [Gammaproteobacteria bacterium]